MPDLAYIALGSNLGDRAAWLATARNAVSMERNVLLRAASTVEETAPLGDVAQGPYLNQMIALETTLDPHALLHRLQRIERRLGRVRGVRWGARIIDLDIVRFGAGGLTSPTLTLPHPGLETRDFWQREAAELDRLLASAA